MSKPGALVVGALLGAGAVYGALNFHVLRTDNGIDFVRKSQTNLQDTYVDVRHFGIGDWLDHSQLAEDVAKAGKQGLMGDAAAESVEQGFSNVFGGKRK